MVIQNWDVARTIENLEIEDCHVVLDLGCGNGRHSRIVDQFHPRLLIDLDIDLGGLDQLKRKNPPDSSQHPSNCIYVCADALKLPFPNLVFDRAICSLVLYFLPFQTALAEFNRIMKPGGKAYVRVPMLSWTRAIDVLRYKNDLRGAIFCACQVFSGFCYAITGYQFPSLVIRKEKWACYISHKRFEEAILRAGFQIEYLHVSYSKLKIPSIDAQLRKL
jgi:ubiquinone/menaquinone biosynthesis C-methylase UbiE